MKKAVKAVLLSLVITLMMGMSIQAKPKLNHSKLTLYKGVERQLTVKNSTSKVKWLSSNSKVAKVNKNGVVTGKKLGKATITAKVGSKRLKCNVKVVNPSFRGDTLYGNKSVGFAVNDIYSEAETGDVCVVIDCNNYREDYDLFLDIERVYLDGQIFDTLEDWCISIEPGESRRVLFWLDGEEINEEIRDLSKVNRIALSYFVDDDIHVVNRKYATSVKLNKYVDPEKENASTNDPVNSRSIVANKKTGKVHKTGGCSKQPTTNAVYFDSEEAANRAGYTDRCKLCKW